MNTTKDQGLKVDGILRTAGQFINAKAVSFLFLLDLTYFNFS
jgi:hypothetical protein